MQKKQHEKIRNMKNHESMSSPKIIIKGTEFSDLAVSELKIFFFEETQFATRKQIIQETNNIRKQYMNKPRNLTKR